MQRCVPFIHRAEVAVFIKKLVLKLSGGIIDVSFRNSQQRQDVLSGFGIRCQIFDEGSDGIVVHLRRTLGDSGFAHNAEVDNIFCQLVFILFRIISLAFAAVHEA